MDIPFSKISCKGNELKYVTKVIESGWLTTASFANLFEREFANQVGSKYACAVNSCTAALHLALEALGVKKGDKVFVPSMTFTATAEVIRYLDADPIFLDCDINTRLITPKILTDALNKFPDVKFLMVTHFGGQSAQMSDLSDNEGLLSICKRKKIKIVEDAAHAFPTKHDGKMVGSFGDVTCFSFYANKTITTGEGGMLVTNNEAIWDRVKKMRLHGINRDIWDRFTNNKSKWEYDVIAPGYKYNMPDINAAIGLAQLERAEELRRKREDCCRFYHANLKNIDGLSLPVINSSWENHSCHLYPVLVSANGLSRNQFIEQMSNAGIGVSVHYKPLHRMAYYKEKYNLFPYDFPNCEYIWQRTVSLPVYPDLTENELEYICTTIKSIFK